MISATDLLAFEDRWGDHSGNKEEAIRREMSLAPARYYQLLNRAIDTEEALRTDPVLVHRLRRTRDTRRQRRPTATTGR